MRERILCIFVYAITNTIHTIVYDACNSNEERIIPKNYQKQHEADAAFIYQLLSHYKAIARDSWIQYLTQPIRGQSVTQKDTWVHVQFDYDISYPEITTNENLSHFKSKMMVSALNIVQHPSDNIGGRRVFIWSQMNRGKGMKQNLSCLDYVFKNQAICSSKKSCKY